MIKLLSSDDLSLFETSVVGASHSPAMVRLVRKGFNPFFLDLDLLRKGFLLICYLLHPLGGLLAKFWFAVVIRPVSAADKAKKTIFTFGQTPEPCVLLITSSVYTYPSTSIKCIRFRPRQYVSFHFLRL